MDLMEKGEKYQEDDFQTMFIEHVIKNYRSNISEINSIIETVNPDELFLQSEIYTPATLCHPIWTLGHLSVSAQGISEEMLVPHWLDDSWIGWFSQQSTPRADRNIYPSLLILTETLDDAVSRVEKSLRSLSEEQLHGPMPDTRYHHIFPTLAHVVSSILIEHTSEHIRMLLLWKFFVLGE